MANTQESKLAGIPYNNLALVHVTNRRPQLSENNNVVIRSAFDSAGGLNQTTDASKEHDRHPFGVSTRPSVHFTIQEPVADHAYGMFEGRAFIIYSPLASAIESNGAPESLMSADTAFFAPYKGVELPGSIITEFDTNQSLPSNKFAETINGVMLVAPKLTTLNREHAIELLISAEKENPGFGAYEMSEFAQSAEGARASVEISKALALSQLKCPTINKALHIEPESKLGFDGWSTHPNNVEFAQQLPLSIQQIANIHVGRHDGSLGDKVNTAFRTANTASLVSIGSLNTNPSISAFADDLSTSTLFKELRAANILSELANPCPHYTDDMGASFPGMARTIYGRGEPYSSVKLGIVTKGEADDAIANAKKSQLLSIRAALFHRGVDKDTANLGDIKLNTLLTVSKEWGSGLIPPPPPLVNTEKEGVEQNRYGTPLASLMKHPSFDCTSPPRPQTNDLQPEFDDANAYPVGPER